MFEVKFIKKNIDESIQGLNVKSQYEKPQTCPHCNCNSDATIKKIYHHNSESEKSTYVTFFLQCTCCKKIFIFISRFYKDKDSEFCMMHPTPHTVFQNEQIEKLSPRFIDVYNQALRSEDCGDIILASVGFRTALEILIKDYAIKVNITSYRIFK